MSIGVRFACGHAAQIPLTANEAVCPTCGETRVARVSAPAPRFRGACRGPYAVTEAVTPGVVNVAVSGPLKLKESR